MNYPEPKILILNIPGTVLKSGSRWYNVIKKGPATLKYYPYPWFMGYATSLLKKNGFNVVLKDAIALEWTEQQTLDFIREFKPTHVICEPAWVSVIDDKRFLQAVGTGVTKIIVGNYVTNFPAEALASSGADCGVVGEYEFSLLEYFNHRDQLPKNFISRDKPDFTLPDLVEDLDQFPFPERDDTPIRYYNQPSCYGINVVVVSSRGCRLRCSFCNVECIYGKHHYRMRSAANVVDELEYLKSKYTFDEIYFDDDNMVSKKSHIEGICREILRRNLKISWTCMGDGLVDDETLTLLARAGCATYQYGLEHLDPDVLKAIPKPLESNRLIRIIHKCHELGMRAYVNTIVGLPNSTREKDLSMLKTVIKAGPDLIQISMAIPYPGTRFHKNAKANGWLLSEDPSFYDATGKCPVSYANYSGDEIAEVFHLGWKMWYRHVLLRKPSTLWFFISSEIKRNGLIETVKKIAAYFIKTFIR